MECDAPSSYLPSRPWKAGWRYRFWERRDRPFLPSHASPANLAGISKLRPSSLACACGNRFSDFQAWRSVPAFICRPSGCHSLCGQRRPVSFSFIQNRPRHARYFVGQSDSSYLKSFARRQSFQPGTEARVLLGPELQHRMRSLHEKFSQVLVSTSAGPGELLLASGGVFSWNHAEPCGKSSALLEGCPVADGCDRSRSDGRSDSRDRHQAITVFKFSGDAQGQLMALPELSVQVLHLQPQLAQQYS